MRYSILISFFLSLFYPSVTLIAQDSLNSFFIRNVKHLELNESLGDSYSYSIPSSINSVSTSGTKMKIDYNMYDANGKVMYNHIVTIDLSQLAPGLYEVAHSGNYNSSSYEYCVSFNSTSDISKIAINQKDGHKYTSNSGPFYVYCDSYEIAKELYNLIYQAMIPFLPHYEYTEQGVKECFSKIQEIMREFKIQSGQVSRINGDTGDFAKTNGVKFSFSKGNLILTYRDSYENGCSGGNFIPGKYTYTFPICKASIAYRRRYSHMKYATDLTIYVSEGITQQRNSEKTIVQDVTLCADKIVIINITQNLLKLQELIKVTGFSGDLGISTSISNRGSNNAGSENKNISGKFGL